MVVLTATVSAKGPPETPDAPTAAEIDDWFLTASEGTGKVPKSLLQALTDGVKASPLNAKLHAALGLASLRSKGKDKEGVKHLREALALNANFPGLHQRLALKLQERTPADKWARNEAVALHRTALRLNPRDDESYYQIGRLQEQLDGKDRQGKPLADFDPEAWAKRLGGAGDEVAGAWREALKANPAHWASHHALSHRLVHSSSKKRRSKAREHAETAVELSPSHPAGYHALATAILRASASIAPGAISVENASDVPWERREEAMAALRSAVRLERPRGAARDARHERFLHDHLPDSYYELGLLLLTARSPEQHIYRQALDSFRDALKLRPADSRYALAERNCKEHLTKIMTMPQGRARQDDDEDGGGD